MLKIVVSLPSAVQWFWSLKCFLPLTIPTNIFVYMHHFQHGNMSHPLYFTKFQSCDLWQFLTS
jgi:hypothetical protein